jgi:hypothetical protein
MRNLHFSDAASPSPPDSGDGTTSRLAEMLAQGSEQLLKLQRENTASVVSAHIRLLETPLTAADATAAMWQLPELYCALFELVAQRARESYRVMSQINHDIVELVCDSVAAQGPVVAQVIAGSSAAFADRRTSSVVIDFPDRRGMIAAATAAEKAPKRMRKD